MLRRVSLANKCLLLFGLAVVLIIVAALAVPWLRMNNMVDQAELAAARQVVAAWEASVRRTELPPATNPTPQPPTGNQTSFQTSFQTGLQPGDRLFLDQARLEVIGPERARQLAESKTPQDLDELVLAAWNALTTAAPSGGPGPGPATSSGTNTGPAPAPAEFTASRWGLSTRQYLYAKAIREPARTEVGPGGVARVEPGPVQGVTVLTRTSPQAAREMLLNTGALLAAGCVALGLAVLVFYLITNRIVLSPVRRLRQTAELVRSGNMDTRSDIHTGDEFEDLAEAFNDMLGVIQSSQAQLRSLNNQLDDKLTELGQRNVALADATRLKGEFLAGVTHELRTPLNSIIGFAELLDEQLSRDAEAGYDPQRLAKRRRYIDNINSAGRALLELINGLLEMARVEAGKVQLVVAPLPLKDFCETMAAMMKPVADKREVELRVETVGVEDLPPIATDQRKLQQILYNLLSNAIKFTADAADHRQSQMAQMDPAAAEKLSRSALVTLRAEHLPPRAADGPESIERVRLCVLDTGPGIKPEDQARIFEKFTQLDSGLSRRHAGTGLGLSIVKELTTLLQGEVYVQSELGMGAMFAVVLPVRLDPNRTAEVRLEQGLRGALSAGNT